MNIQELFPFVGGFILGSLLGLLETSARTRIGVLLTICIGLLATLTSGEFRLHWAFALLDISLVAASVVAGLLCTHLMQSVLSKQALRKR
jgi:hypothetical protein